MRTFVASAKSVDSRWHVIDASGQVLGRVATLAARLLQGKHKAVYTPFIDTGNHAIVINARSGKLTGAKETGDGGLVGSKVQRVADKYSIEWRAVYIERIAERAQRRRSAAEVSNAGGF